MMPGLRGIGFLAVVLVPVVASAQGQPLGPEFRANTYTAGHQTSPAVGVDSGGNFVVVWASDGQDGSASGIFGQRYSGGGSPLGAEFQVNTYTTGSQTLPAVAADPAGNFVVVWTGTVPGSFGPDVFGQRYSSSGAPLGPEFRVNSYANNVTGPSVAADSLGSFVVVWDSFSAIWGQRFASSGTPLGPQFQIDVAGPPVSDPSVAWGASNNFIVTWMRSLEYIVGRVYSSSGAPLGTDFVIAEPHHLMWANRAPAVASDPAGNFVVAWTGGYFLGPFDVFGRRMQGNGAPFGLEFQINTFAGNTQYAPAVATDLSGNFVVVWNSFAQDGPSLGVFGQRFLSSGTPFGPEFRVNTYTVDAQRDPSVAADSLGNFVVAWGSSLQDGSGDGVFGQRFAQIVPVELTSFTID